MSINGANRLGSNSLTECLVFGARAGRAAAAFAAEQHGKDGMIQSQVQEEERRLCRDYLEKTGGKERVSQIRSEMQRTMEDSAGIYRNGDSLRKAAAKLRTLQERYRNISIEDRSFIFNTDLVAVLELGYMLDIAETMVQSAARREESRGSHQRSDFPARDDCNYLKHSLAYRREHDAPSIDYAPVLITRWPPGERIYGR